MNVAVRRDGGDAERGVGIDIGGALSFSSESLNVEARGRRLLAHEEGGFEDWGASAGLAWRSQGAKNRGPMLNLRQSWGGSDAGGQQTLFSRPTLGSVSGGERGIEAAGRLEGEVGYRIGLPGRLVGTPYAGFGTDPSRRDMRMGWRLNSESREFGGFAFEVEGTRNEARGSETENEAVVARLQVNF